MKEKNLFIPYSKPSISEEEIKKVIEVMKSGWLTSGPKVIQFENDFKTFISKENNLEAISVNSATSGLHLALEACGIGGGDEIITTSLTFTATAEVARYLGAEVKFIDIEPNSMNIDVKQIRKKITKNTKAIIAVHYAGLSCEMDEIFKIAKEFDLKVIEDAAHALPSSYLGSLIGSLRSDATVFSFYANKNITTGEGGMVVTRSEDMAKRMRLMRLHGMDRDAYDRFTSQKGSWYYEIIAPGFKYNLTDLSAAIGIEQLKKLPMLHEKRKKLANKYFDELKDLPIILPSDAPAKECHSWHLFVIRLKKDLKITRDELIKKMNKDGIGTSVHYVPLHLQPYWKNRYELDTKDFKETNKAYNSMVRIPLYPDLSEEDQERVIMSLQKNLG